MADPRALTGCVTGRFQPVHNDHVELFLHVLGLHEHLIVGITNPDPAARHAHPDNDSRHLKTSNPFTFYERLRLARAALDGAGVNETRYDIVPFPLGDPGSGHHYVPHDTVQYVRTFSPWERSKVEMLREAGYVVEVIRGNQRTRISASDIRAALRSGERWHHLMPAGSADLVESYLSARPLRDRVSA